MSRFKKTSKEFWKASDRTIWGFPAIEHNMTSEIALHGHYGEIWVFSTSLLSILIRNEFVARLTNRRYKLGAKGLKKAFKNGIGEIVLRVPNTPDNVRILTEILEISKDPNYQATLANDWLKG